MSCSPIEQSIVDGRGDASRDGSSAIESLKITYPRVFQNNAVERGGEGGEETES